MGSSLGSDVGAAERLIGQLAEAGIDFAHLIDGLERQGVEAFRDSYHQLLNCIEERIASLRAEASDALVSQRAGQ